MPHGEIEIHPYLQEGESIPGTSLILGSFPVYECTDEDSPGKSEQRLAEGTFRFFYGSNQNKFWSLYKKYVDNNIEAPYNSQMLIESLNRHRLPISDTIRTAEREGYSSLDSDLTVYDYNTLGIITLIQRGINKILCTSKGVMQTLESKIFCNNLQPLATVNHLASVTFRNSIMNATGGQLPANATPVCRVFDTANGAVHAMAIPSPGSWQRQITKFGCPNGGREAYRDAYYEFAFTWLIS